MALTKIGRSCRRILAGAVAASAMLMAASLAACSGSAQDGSDPVSASTLRVGIANMDTGTISFPGAPKGAMVAQDYINNELGGINGHTLELVGCDLQNTIQAAQACGQKFSADAAIPFALATLNTMGNTSFSAALERQGKPVLGGVGITPADLADPNTYWAYTGSPAAYGDWGKLATAVSDAAGIDQVVHIGSAGSQSAATGFEQMKDNLGPGIDTVDVAAPANSPDYLAVIRSAKVSSNSVLMINIPTADTCGSIAKELDRLGIKPKAVLTSTACATVPIVQATPELFEGWILTAGMEDPHPGSTRDSEEIEIFKQAWEKYGEGDITEGQPRYGWALVMTMYEILKASGQTEITSESFRQAILDYHGSVVIGGGGKMACPGAAPYTSMCNTFSVVYTIEDGEFTLGSEYSIE